MEFFQDYITSTIEDVTTEDQLLLERRISPYATLRPGDLVGLLKLHSPVAFKAAARSHENRTTHNIEGILSREEQGLSSGEETDDVDDEDVVDVVCRGADHNHVPTQHLVRGLKRHEMPVVGVCVDNRICPGFRYRVRRAGSDRFLFNNEARTLLTVGMGYGRRLTFSGETLNNNDTYFWSDSEPNGFAFSIQAVDIQQRFSVLDEEGTVVAESVVEKIYDPQEEISMVAHRGEVTKRVNVALTCTVVYYNRFHHGLVELMASESQETITGIAIVTKKRSSKDASLEAIENVFLQRIGQCKFLPEV